MLERIADLPSGVLGLRATGEITKEDYESVLEPLLDHARQQGEKIRFLYHLGPDFTGFTAGAAWEDARVGFQYLRLFERLAVVTDTGWVQQSTRFIGALLPCPVKVFGNSELGDAAAWLSSFATEAAVSHRLLPDKGVLVVQPGAPIRAEDLDAIALTVDPWIESHGSLHGLLIHVPKFPGWENIGSMIRHIRFVRDHHRKIMRIAFAADGTIADIAPKLAEHFVEAKVKQFDYDDFEDALEWASGGDD